MGHSVDSDSILLFKTYLWFLVLSAVVRKYFIWNDFVVFVCDFNYTSDSQSRVPMTVNQFSIFTEQLNCARLILVFTLYVKL